MDILLINPPARQLSGETIVIPPLGLAYLAAVARQAGHRIELLDAFGLGLSWEAFEYQLGTKRYDLIGLTGMTPVFDNTQRAIPLCRPRARYLILGGPHATAFRETILQDNPLLDYAIYGEGEETFIELLTTLEQGADPTGLAGLITRCGIGPQRSYLKDLDQLPWPARDLLPNHRYRYPLSSALPMTTIMSSRGCPYPCIFCDKGVFGSKWRARSAENILAEVDRIVKDLGVQSIIFYDDLFTLQRERVLAFCEGLIQRNYRLTWKAEGRVDRVDAELLALMRRAGCDTMAYGVETANQIGLDYLGKQTSPDVIRQAFTLTQRAGIKTMGYFILGLPVETYEQAQKTICFAIELDCDYAQFSILSPLPGTPLYQQAVDLGWYREVAAQNISDKDRLRPVVMSENWDEAKLIDIVHQAHRRFYLRPSYILKSLARIRSCQEIGELIGLGWDMVKYVLGKKVKSQ